MASKINHAFIGKNKVVLSMKRESYLEELTDEVANEYLVELGILNYTAVDKFEKSEEVSHVYAY